jgi:glycosyltransferase involved in cell wall biosynthesis
MDRQRIAIYTASLRVGGAERFVVNLAAELVRRGYPVDIVLASAEGPLLEQAPPEARIIDLRARQVSRSVPRLMGYLRAEHPAAMLTLQTHCNIAGILAQKLARRRVRIVVSEHNSAYARMRSRFSKETLLLKLGHWLYPQAQAIVAVSRALAGELAEALHLERAKVITVYNPIVDQRVLAQAELPLEHPWFASGQPPVILSAGRLVRQKDHATLLRAFSRLRRNTAARLLILGEGEERDHLAALAADLGVEGDVSLAGVDTNPYRYMRHCGVFVLSSAWEGFGNVLVEAMACGAPVVSTDCQSGPAEILEDGRYGLLVPVGDDEALATAMAATLDRPLASERLKERARDFQVASSADAYLRLLLGEPA